MTETSFELSPLEQDLLKELFNLGVGKAAASLSRMVKQEILLSVPEVKLERSSALVDLLGDKQSVVTVSQNIQGPFDAKSMLLFPDHGGMEVVKQMLGAHLTEETLAELQEEALSEIGNVVLNACIGAVSKSMNSEFEVDIPIFEQTSTSDLLKINCLSTSDTILLININMTLKMSNVEGYLAFVFTPLSLNNLHKSLKQLISSLS